MKAKIERVEIFGVAIAHVNVTSGANYAFLQFDNSLGAYQHTAGGALDVAAVADGSVDAERNGIGEGQLNLAGRPRGTQNAHIRQHHYDP